MENPEAVVQRVYLPDEQTGKPSSLPTLHFDISQNVCRQEILKMTSLAKLTAYHENGHAIVAFNTKGAHPIRKATIMPRGSALGIVMQLPTNDETSVSKKQLLARLDLCIYGRKSLSLYL
ncbi:hypothetical protein Bca52824_004229 [Brassica carinata]|uniref:Peptidase M41 domain-containing protein n=1 Tax=Brassica carinata TaxID=52824 RepID=A0A8X7WNR6_BRACI|nr:hypothetical protein Bca52824_004229 [Brassica carinata]